ncbi:unnamed protein product [Paramecium pentaurelia]|uniref:Uncharacterized protein n=1 Tax=Paramecium pentaurelia TaxID=43138 RepID=A0A8S1S0S2_9CILI|nr:unnamed protein product [Paramecium pentaurelia]
MGSKPCCCESPNNSIKEIKIIIHQLSQEFQIPANIPQKPVPLQMMQSLKEEDDFGLFLVMEQYERLLHKQNYRIKSFSPSYQIQTETKDFTTTYNLKKHVQKINLKKSRSLTNSKISTSSQKSAIKSILKQKPTQNQISYKQQISAPQRSIKSVHFNPVLSPKNRISRQSQLAKKRIFLRSYL